MSTKPLVIFGIGEIGELAGFYFEHDTPREVVAFTVDREYMAGETFCGKPVVPFEELPARYPPDRFDLFIAVSYAKLNAVRMRKYLQATDLGYALATYVSSRATVWPGFRPGDNCFILEDNTIQPFARVGSNVTLWSGNHIGHHSTIESHCFLASHIVVSGGCVIGEQSFVGVNATFHDHVTVGKRNIIAAGALIKRSTGDDELYTAAPAKKAERPASSVAI